MCVCVCVCVCIYVHICIYIILEKEALKRKKGQRKCSQPIELGSRDFLKSQSARGRNKIRDIFSQVPYKVVGGLNKGNLYTIKPLDGLDDVKYVNRDHIIKSVDVVKMDSNICLKDNFRNSEKQSPDLHPVKLDSDSETETDSDPDDSVVLIRKPHLMETRSQLQTEELEVEIPEVNANVETAKETERQVERDKKINQSRESPNAPLLGHILIYIICQNQLENTIVSEVNDGSFSEFHHADNDLSATMGKRLLEGWMKTINIDK